MSEAAASTEPRLGQRSGFYEDSPEVDCYSRQVHSRERERGTLIIARCRSAGRSVWFGLLGRYRLQQRCCMLLPPILHFIEIIGQSLRPDGSDR